MSKKNTNPYRDGTAYAGVFAAMRAAGSKGISRKDLLANHAPADVTVVTSPRKEGTVRDGADCRGNFSAQGHIYYAAVIGGKDTEKRFRLAWRKPVMEKRSRKAKPSVSQRKSETKAKAPSKTAATA